MADIVGKEMPDFDITDKEGVTTKFSEFRDGKIVLIDFYTSWWGGCNGKARTVDKLANDNKDNENIKFLLVNIEKDGDVKKKIAGFTEKNELKTVKHYSGQAPALVGLQYIPHCVLVGADGKIVENKNYTDAAITKLLNPPKEEEVKEEDAEDAGEEE